MKVHLVSIITTYATIETFKEALMIFYHAKQKTSLIIKVIRNS